MRLHMSEKDVDMAKIISKAKAYSSQNKQPVKTLTHLSPTRVTKNVVDLIKLEVMSGFSNLAKYVESEIENVVLVKNTLKNGRSTINYHTLNSIINPV